MGWTCSASRRFFLRSLSLAPAALLFVGGKQAHAQDAAAPAAPSQCPVDPHDGLPSTLNFAEISANPEQPCRRCTFWTADSSGACGACVILTRPTPSTAHCNSWALGEGR